MPTHSRGITAELAEHVQFLILAGVCLHSPVMRLLIAVASVASLSACTVSVLPITCDDTATPCGEDGGIPEPEPPPFPEPFDGGPPRPDSGPFRPDAGPDARPDARPDAAPDAGPDANPDAGDPCEGVVCNLPNSTSTCVQGKCVATSCNQGAGDCDNDMTNGCEPLSWFFEDKDGDGHGVPDVSTETCTAPPGFSTLADDCDDGDGRAFPGQTQYFSTPRASGGFDFNCDGGESLQNTRVDPQQCICNGDACSLSRGWKSTVPNCGDSAEYAVGPVSPDACDINYVDTAQGCR